MRRTYTGKRETDVDWDEVKRQSRAGIPKIREILSSCKIINFKIEEPHDPDNPPNHIIRTNAFVVVDVWFPPTDQVRRRDVAPYRLIHPTDEELLQLSNTLDQIQKELPHFRITKKFRDADSGFYTFKLGPNEYPKKK